MSVAAWSPLSGGVLPGKFTRPGGAAEGTRVSAGSLSEHDHAIARVVGEVAVDLDASAAQVAIAWTRTRSRSVHPILGARRLDQLLSSASIWPTVPGGPGAFVSSSPGPLPGSTAIRPALRRYTREDIQRSNEAKREKYAAIRRDAGNGMSERAIERKHHVGRRTIVKALASADPPQRKKIHREPAALNGLHVRIDAMIESDPKIATATIWQRLADEHGTTAAYPTLRTYVTSRRRSEDAGQELAP